MGRLTANKVAIKQQNNIKTSKGEYSFQQSIVVKAILHFFVTNL